MESIDTCPRCQGPTEGGYLVARSPIRWSDDPTWPMLSLKGTEKLSQLRNVFSSATDARRCRRCHLVYFTDGSPPGDEPPLA